MATEKPIPYDGVHPFTSTRLQVITDAATADHMTLGLFGMYTQALNEDETAKVSKLPQTEQKERASVRQYTTFFAQRLRGVFLEKIAELNLARFTGEHFRTAERLRIHLESGIPIGCKRQVADETILDRLSLLTQAATVTEIREVFELYREVPVRVAEVLTAAWIANTGRKIKALTDAFALGDIAGVFPFLQQSLERQDALVMKSIEMISVIKEMVNAPQ